MTPSLRATIARLRSAILDALEEAEQAARNWMAARDATVTDNERLAASVAELEACSECAGKGCHACRSTGHVRSQVEALRLERDRLTARVVELERELDDDVSPADEARIEEQKRLATAEARCAELEDDCRGLRVHLGVAADSLFAAADYISALEDTIDWEKAWDEWALHPEGSLERVEVDTTIAKIQSRRGAGWKGAR